MITLQELYDWRDKMLRADTGPRFMGWPESWLEDPTYICPNGHASARYLKTDDGGLCLACHATVIVGPPISEAEFKKVTGDS